TSSSDMKSLNALADSVFFLEDNSSLSKSTAYARRREFPAKTNPARFGSSNLGEPRFRVPFRSRMVSFVQRGDGGSFCPPATGKNVEMIKTSVATYFIAEFNQRDPSLSSPYLHQGLGIPPLHHVWPPTTSKIR